MAAALGDRTLALVMFGYGVVCWITLGSVVLARLFNQPALPVPLRPTVAIELAPPVVAGVAWLRLDGGRVDTVALGLAGYALPMALVQVRLVPLLRGVPFGPGWWALSFPYAAACAYTLQLLAHDRVPGLRAWTWVLLAVVTSGAALLVGRTVAALVRGRFLPTEPGGVAA